MLFKIAVILIALDGPNGQVIWLNPHEVVSMRTPRGKNLDHYGPEIKCIIQTADGKFVAVVNDCDDVSKRINVPKEK